MTAPELHARLTTLETALELWAGRDDTIPQPEVRRAANAAGRSLPWRTEGSQRWECRRQMAGPAPCQPRADARALAEVNRRFQQRVIHADTAARQPPLPSDRYLGPAGYPPCRRGPARWRTAGRERRS